MDIADFIKREIAHNGKQTKSLPNIFIVHGHDTKSLSELKKYIQNTLKLGQPIVLKEMKSDGLTVIEKFERYAENIDIAFVLITPDDFISVQSNKEVYFQARPNVIFELGYLMGLLNRRTGRVITLVNDRTRMFSDLAGLINIDISEGILRASENIKTELADWL